MSFAKWFAIGRWMLMAAVLSQVAWADPRLRVQRWSVEEGLSQASVNTVLQSGSGLMWIGTHDGLNRFDGYAFTAYRADPTNPQALTHSYVTSLVEAPDGMLWVGTMDGLNAFDPGTGRVRWALLPGVPVRAARFDPSGHLWVGTPQGLYRVNPATRTVTDFQPEAGLGNAWQAAKQVYAIALDGARGLWLGLECGLGHFDFATERLTLMTERVHGRSLTERLRFIHPMPDGILWLGHQSVMLRFDPRTNQAELLAVTDAHTGRPASDWLRGAQCGVMDDDGRVWIGSEEQTLCLDPATGRAWRFTHQPANPTSVSHNAVRALCHDRAGGLWLGTAAGLNRYDPNAPVFVPYRHEVGNPNSLGYDAVSTCFEDRQGRLWIGTDGGGLDCLDVEANTFTHFTAQSPPPYRLAGNRIWRIAEDHRGTLWFAGGSGGLGRRDPATGTIRWYRPNPRRPRSFSSEVVYALFVDRDGVLWIGTEMSGLARYDAATDDFTHFRHQPVQPQTIPSDTVSSIIEDGQGWLWIGTPQGVARLDRQTGVAQPFVPVPGQPGQLGDGRVTKLFRDSAGEVWVGTRLGLYHFDSAHQTFRAFCPAPGQPFVGRTINDIVESPPGTLWVGTEDGLNRIERATGQVVAFTVRDGLPASRVLRLHADATGKLWLGLNLGLGQFDPVRLRFQLFDVRDGLVDNQAWQSFFQRRNGDVLFVSVKGFTVFRPEAIHPNPVPPPVVITGFRKFDRLAAFDGDALPPLDHDENFFAFEFAALNYTVPERNQYAYKLEGFDRDWVYCGTRRYASYTNLDPGEYVFWVRGSNNSGVWNEAGTRVRIRIRPAPWRTWWAYAGYLLLVAGGAWFGLRLRSSRQQARERLREAQLRAQAAEGQAKAAAALATVRERDAEIFRLRNIELAEANQFVTDSLLYAQRIQAAILPEPRALAAAFGEAFVIYRPKDIVSGDFYWFHRTEAAWFLAVGDCTGHGVPGALMTMVGATLLDQMVIERGLSSPAAILSELDAAVRQLLRQDTAQSDTQDGMDIALCRFERERGCVTFAGARRPLYVVTEDGNLTEHRGSRRTIGGRHGRGGLMFEEISLVVEDSVSIYLGTDGLADQPNEERRKFGTPRLRAHLQQVAAMPFARQSERLAAELDSHMGAEPQRDDITLVGVHFAGCGALGGMAAPRSERAVGALPRPTAT
ncbi:SpoIIE family protein phosphatase [Chloracidobacterium validum]|uniref:SpoIIE family protein phosphatase n=1 Tax=Chloracidobacterium validum TaxID=2821543 RepID=A0ABX8BBX5_9BACT|nr:two-component regulator propeller domain-containing protein [Chloracidobacterium validum]QUW04204.1 SpoIIE family protein phosphatase [Chloracidobacterium validum]